MAKTLSPEQCRARAVAYAEAAEHLRQQWTDDATERDQGNHVSEILEREATSWTLRAYAKSYFGAASNGSPEHTP